MTAAAAEEPFPPPPLPFPIFQLSPTVPRYLLYSIQTISYLRRTHHILGVLIGSLPQSPQQNVFLGLPLELQPQEVKLLVDEGLAFIVDDLRNHVEALREPPAGLEGYKEDVRREGWVAAKAVEKQKLLRTREALRRLGGRQSTTPKADDDDGAQDGSSSSKESGTKDEEDDSLFDVSQKPQNSQQSKSSTLIPYTSTRTTSHPPLPAPAPPPQQPSPLTALTPNPNPSSYALFKHLHTLGYFLSPGLRFGCRFLVYPGDPLRFHSHFLAVSVGWDEEIDLRDLVGGGRLGTGVKKGWLIGGEEREGEEKEEGEGGEGRKMARVRTFCIEWGGM
ncbi:hypothetical protein Q9189_000439 [Teloschistes chrysophthalmus]